MKFNSYRVAIVPTYDFLVPWFKQYYHYNTVVYNAFEYFLKFLDFPNKLSFPLKFLIIFLLKVRQN